ncbi:putative beta-mannosidase [Neohortaea acidophila]|uniref:Beta-mannosidase B n=1 Tax=Neohortaea acidophila TaxID=245834 RepID=A0A6A6PW44_9PEZI|nr:putative beta-mannosidase [Neohortaea acidophila]KAF2484262.1 putative beta-mannosidase [Neohortaea acidophila]
MTTKMRSHELTDDWQFRQADAGEWLPVKRVPTNVHLDLIDNHVIDDPFFAFNELKCQWVGEATWVYRLALPDISQLGSHSTHVLAFDGLDTFAIVRLNGKEILRSDNMWIMHRVDITKHLHSSNNGNFLEIEFAPALVEARRIKDAHPKHRWVGFNGEMSRLAVRKAQYHWGWDWGPVLMTCGPWRAVRLESYTARIDDIRVDYELSPDLRKATGTIRVKTEAAKGMTVSFNVKLNGAEVFAERTCIDHDGQASVEFYVDQPKLWYPHGYGAQPLYDLRATLLHNGQEQHSVSRRTGLRRAELVQEPDESGKSFYFRINNIDVFCGGSNWIPADSFTPRVTSEKLRGWLQMMVDGYQTMIRNWGGGNWEEDEFYDLCDELGVLVWQDFMFGCGNYPAFPEILSSIERESVCQMKRLRHHPSLVIYAGNNEDYQVQESYGLTYDYEDKCPESWLKTDFPARYIYEKLLPEVVAAHCPHVVYHPGSPWGDGKISSDPTVGDMHQWNVWHGTQEKYQIFDTLGGRFNSEFGMEAFPHIDTIRSFVDDISKINPQSQIIDFHNKADGHERRIATYLVENFRLQTDFKKYIHLTQLSQAEALMFGYRGWRHQWGGKVRHCGGALVWQLNDCWPTISWAIVDYYQRKKPAYYAMRRVLAPIAVAVKREHHDWSVVHAHPAKSSTYQCWVSSSRLVDVEATVELRFISIQTGKEIKERITKKQVTIAANHSTEICEGVIDHEHEEPHVLAARIWIGDEVVARDVDWPQPLKYLDFCDRGVKVKRKGNEVTVTAEKPTKGLVFEEREGLLISDSAIDVVPGDEQVLTVRGLGPEDKDLDWLYLGAP